MKRCVPWLVLVGIVATSGPIASVSGAGAAKGPPTKTIPAHFTDAVSTDNCHSAIGISFAGVPHAISYSITYWDGYYQTVEPASLTPEQLKQDDAPYRANHSIKGADFFVPITGGWGSGPCKKGKNDPTDGGRFSKGATVVAMFPPNYKPKKPTVEVSIVLHGDKVTVGSSVEVKVKVTAGKVTLTKVNLGKGLEGVGSVAEITDRPAGLSGFSLAPHHSKVFRFTLEAKREGTETLSAQADATSNDGLSAQGTDSKGLSIGQKALAVTVAANPSTVRLELDGDTLKPQVVKVTVTIKNLLQKPVTNATLCGSVRCRRLQEGRLRLHDPLEGECAQPPRGADQGSVVRAPRGGSCGGAAAVRGSSGDAWWSGSS